MPNSSAAAILPHASDSMIAELAYFKAEQRGFEPGHEVADWLAAEREVEALLLGTAEPSPKKTKRKKK